MSKPMKYVSCVLVSVLIASGTLPAAELQSAPPHWISTWAAPADSAGRAFQAQTVRQVVRVSIGGSSLRIRLSNLFGAQAVTIGPVRIAAHAGGSSMTLDTMRAVTFGGKAAVTIPKGADVLSDSVAFHVAPLQEIAISMFLPQQTGPSTMHNTAIQTAYIAAGDATAASMLPVGETDSSRFFLTDVDVAAEPQARLLVAVGDSITDGVGSTDDRNMRWPDALAARLQANPKLASIAVVNSGISGNRILNDGFERFIGPSVLSRLDRDALNKPGVRWMILMSGGNDISAANVLPRPQDKVSAEQIIEGMKKIIARARANGVEIWGATLSPRAGTKPPFYSEAGEAKRRAVNAWIRTSGAFDAVIDFDIVLQDPARPDALRADYDSGDHLHPNDAGFRAMANAIDLRLFDRPPHALIDARKKHYRRLGEAFKTIQDQSRRDAPDISAIRRAAQIVSEAAAVQTKWFPAWSAPQSGVETRAKSDIWTRPLDFQKATDAFAAAAPKLAAAARTADARTVRTDFAAVGRTCKGCHVTFRMPDEG